MVFKFASKVFMSVIMAGSFILHAQAFELKPHKDRLFKNRKPIEVNFFQTDKKTNRYEHYG